MTDNNTVGEVTELTFNVDDMTGEQAAFALTKLFEAGANEAYTAAVTMKKGRPGLEFTVICHEENRDAVLAAIFRHTSTIGVRGSVRQAFRAQRKTVTVTTPAGVIKKKISAYGDTVREKYEYDDLSAAADKLGVSLFEIQKYAQKYDTGENDD